MKVIFLDIDGVLNSHRTYYTLGNIDEWKCLDPIAVGLIRRLCEKTNAWVVISSTWRILYDIEEFKKNFEDIYGWKIPLIDITENLSVPRGQEIQKWLDENNEVNEYVIIDDDSDMLPGQNFVSVNVLHGFSITNYFEAYNYLDPYNKDIKKQLESTHEWNCKPCKQKRMKKESPDKTDKLFEDEGDVNSFHDAVFEALGKSLSKDRLMKLFDVLPEETKQTAYEWSLSDTPFRDEAYTYIKDNIREVNIDVVIKDM